MLEGRPIKSHHYEIIQEYCKSRDIQINSEDSGVKIIMRIDIERQAFAFGPNGTFDALNASIILC